MPAPLPSPPPPPQPSKPRELDPWLRGGLRSWPIAPRIALVPDILMRGQGISPEAPGSWAFTESCIFRTALSGVLGGAMGMFFGAVFSGYGSLAPYDPALRDWQATVLKDQHAAAVAAAAKEAKAAGRPIPLPAPFAPIHLPGLQGVGIPSSSATAVEKSIAQHLKEGIFEMRVRAISQGRTFALVGAVYSGFECSIEWVRAKKDLKGAVASGFFTGAALAAQAGPQAMLLGGAGFAAFSVAIELLSPMLFDH